MNDADRKAFDMWWEYGKGNHGEQFDAWQAACKWRDSQVGEPVAMSDADRYRWLFNARTEDECANEQVGNESLKFQDLVIAHVATNFMCKEAVDAVIDKFMQQEAALVKARGEQTK